MNRFAVGMSAIVLTAAIAGNVAAKVDFESQVKPILEKRCYECHGPEKQKGDLRMDDLKAFQDAEVVVKGFARDSELFVRIILPPDDDEIMPPKGDPLTREETDLIGTWINEGASFEKVAGATPAPATKDKPEAKPAKPIKTPKPLPEVEAADEKALEKLRSLGALAMPLAQNTNTLNVDFRGEADKIGDSHLADLKPLATQIVWLNLANTKISDDGLAQLTALKNLRRLHLENTVIGDAGMDHIAKLTALEYLNLYGTKVTDKGVAKLTPLKDLAKLYLWQTKATKEGGMALAKSIDGLEVNVGWEWKPLPPAEQPAAPDEKKVGTPGVISIAKVMEDAHKSKLVDKVLDGNASDKEIKTLVELYSALPKQKPPKGDEASWKKLTETLLASAKKVADGDKSPEALAALKDAKNCKACHDKHRE